uniref:Neur_chan_LBD domain-containing protein n=2 Tax=Bursaphelenchus xylophilus TaxID=6326 RepID=A0A1I7RLY8_BURXY
MNLAVSVAFLLCTWFVVTFGQKAKKKLKEQDIIQRVLRDYDWRVRPRGANDSWPDTGGPVVVSVNIYLRSISKIDDVNMEYSA